MHFTTFLKKHFDIEKIVGTSDSGNDTESIYVYEKGNDCESLFILRESWINAEIKKSGIWTVVTYIPRWNMERNTPNLN
ncbi:CcgD protein [Escherichia coli]|nr:CcgD protein [Escherichia coli]